MRTVTGENENIGSVSDETIWPAGGIRPKPGPFCTVLPCATVALEIVSDSILDTIAGLGVQVVLVNGLDSAGKEIEQLIDMNGTEPVPIPISLYRIQPSRNAQVGTLRGNDGVISIQGIGGGILYDIIEIDPGGTPFGVTHSGTFTVPAGNVFVLESIFWGTDDVTRALLIQDFRLSGIRVLPVIIQGQEQIIGLPLCFPAFTDIEIRAQSDTGNGQMTVALTGELFPRPLSLTQEVGLCP